MIGETQSTQPDFLRGFSFIQRSLIESSVWHSVISAKFTFHFNGDELLLKEINSKPTEPRVLSGHPFKF